jgi:predicted nucleic acid-binding protein
MIVIADTTPLNYLVVVGYIHLLPTLFGQVVIPPAVWAELQDLEAPESVRQWIRQSPSWLEVRSVKRVDPSLTFLDAGEQEAITLAEEIHADKVLLDEADARREATRRQLSVVGTLGILREGARRNLLDLPTALGALQQTSFYVSTHLIQVLFDEDAEWKQQREQ